MIKIVLEGERPYSLNKFFARAHWTKRNAVSEQAGLKVKAAVREIYSEPPAFSDPVKIEITAFFKNRPIDPDNIMCKVYIDGLVDTGIIQDDSMKEICAVTLKSKLDPKRPRVEIKITECASEITA